MRPTSISSISALAAATLVALSTTAFAAQPLLPSAARDQVPTRLAALPTPVGEFERAPVSFSWPLDPQAELAAPAPYQAQSREFWQGVDAAELESGIDLDLSAPGALIRISPARGARAIRASELRLSGNGRAVGLQQSASDTQLQAAGMAVEPGTAMVKVASDQGAGRYRLQASQAQGRYVVHVLEPDSPIVLQARADRQHALAGESIRLDAAIDNAGRATAAAGEALLVAPDGSSQPVKLRTTGNGRLDASVRLPADAGRVPGLWELQVFASGDGIQRDARTAFVVAQPTARFQGRFAANRQQLRVTLPVETGSAGRYEARGTLYATGPDRLLRPVAQAHSAAWFERGNGALVLAFDPAHLGAGFGAPYELRNLELHDQTRLAPIEIRERAARF